MEYIVSERLTVGYGREDVVKKVELSLPQQKTTSIIGPNGCGKSTLLKALANVIPYAGSVVIDGKNVRDMPRKALAKVLAMLPQRPEATNGLSVEELVMYGRHPYASRLGNHSKADYDKVHWAMEITGVYPYRKRPLEALSGGQRQRVWIALSLAQDTDIIFLDEPTTYLDIAHQLEVLEILDNLKKNHRKTIVMVLHDMNQASKYSDYIIAMKEGEIVKRGASDDVICEDVLKTLFNVDVEIGRDKTTQKPMCLSYSLTTNGREHEKDSMDSIGADAHCTERVLEYCGTR